MALELSDKYTATTYHCTLGGYIMNLSAGEYDLNAPFQRASVWTTEQRVNFIKTLIKQLPVPPVFINSPKSAMDKMLVIDGKQRLEALMAFVQDELVVDGAVWSQQDELFQRGV